MLFIDLQINIYAIENYFLGQYVNVCGLFISRSMHRSDKPVLPVAYEVERFEEELDVKIRIS